MFFNLDVTREEAPEPLYKVLTGGVGVYTDAAAFAADYRRKVAGDSRRTSDARPEATAMKAERASGEKPSPVLTRAQLR